MRPTLSLVLPCYDEEALIERTTGELLAAFEGEALELVLVDNGSRDRTGEKIARLAAADPRVRPCTVPVNRGYGHGVRAGLALARGDWLGFLCADGQVAARDVRALWERHREGPALYKVRRRFRPDGLDRKLLSVGWNALANLRHGGLKALDVNGNPKLWPRVALDPGRLRADDWFLDAEVLILARRRGLRVVEQEVRGRPRAAGRSKVRWRAAVELLLALRREVG